MRSTAPPGVSATVAKQTLCGDLLVTYAYWPSLTIGLIL